MNLETNHGRSWTVSGIAIRHACTLGLNLRNESPDVTDGSKEIRSRVWWALCSTERTLAMMTGRPISFAEKDCTAPLPLPIEEDSFLGAGTQNPQVLQLQRRWSSQESQLDNYARNDASTESSSPSQDPKQPFPPCDALAFGYQTKLSTFSNEVLHRLYRAAGMSESWAHVQATISSLNTKLEDWRLRLPPVFDFNKKQRDQQFLSHCMSLGFFYYSILIIINRPCLCRVDRKIRDESSSAKSFNQETATRCVRAARGMLSLLPDEPDAVGLLKFVPWWCLVHLLMQAATVLMLELSFRAEHMRDEVDEIFDSAKKALEWLRVMSKEDEAARRASVLCNELLRQVAPKVGKNPDEASDFEPGGEHPIQSIKDMQTKRDPRGQHHSPKIEDKHRLQDSNMNNDLNPLHDYESLRGTENTHPGYASGQNMHYSQVGHQTSNNHPPQYDYFTSHPFQPQLFTTYDQMHSYSHAQAMTAAAPLDDLFPTAMDMEGMNFDDHTSPSYPLGLNQPWFPGSGV